VNSCCRDGDSDDSGNDDELQSAASLDMMGSFLLSGNLTHLLVEPRYCNVNIERGCADRDFGSTSDLVDVYYANWELHKPSHEAVRECDAKFGFKL